MRSIVATRQKLSVELMGFLRRFGGLALGIEVAGNATREAPLDTSAEIEFDASPQARMPYWKRLLRRFGPAAPDRSLLDGQGMPEAAVPRDEPVPREDLVARELLASELRYRKLFHSSHDGIFLHRLDGTLVDVNERAVEQLGYSRGELLSMKTEDLHPDYALPATRAAAARLHDEGAVRFSVDFVRHDGSMFPAEVSASLFEVFGEALVQGIVRDLSERRRREAELRQAALYDALTGLPNRALLQDRLAVALAQARRGRAADFALLLIDLDRFERVNDGLGHSRGDELLRIISRRLIAGPLRDQTVARFGGDEFAVVLSDPSGREEVFRLAEEVRSDLREPVDLGGQEVFVTATLGAVVSGSQYLSGEELLRDAGAALHQGKTLGRDRTVIFDPVMHQEAVKVLRLENDLYRALEREEFELHFQPIVSLPDRRIVELEVLLRWRHPQRGLLLPGAFLHQAEENGLILPLGDWVLRQSCRQLASWSRDFGGAPVPGISVNLFSRQFSALELVQGVQDILRETGVEGRQLRLEMTESALIESPSRVAAVLSGLAALGVRVSLDDFGTGYSSLSYLHRLPIHGLKIDRSFVARMGGDGDEIIRTIVLLGHSLGAEVTAEGIEEAGQLQALAELGCDFGQGFFLGRPVAADEAARLLLA